MFELSDSPLFTTAGPSSPTTSQWSLHRKSEDSSFGSLFFQEKQYPFTPATPSTVDSVTAADSFVSSSVRAEQDSVATETESTASTTTETNNRAPAALLKTSTSLPISLECPKNKTIAPDQMRYYMKKHLATQKVSEDEKKTSQ
jgi:hypothetical protein